MNRLGANPFDVARLLSETSLQHVEYHWTLPSTSSTARELLEPLLDNSPALVLASEQTAGRGRTGNFWWSSAGALTFTLVLQAAELPLPAERRPLIALGAGLAVRDVLAATSPEQEFLLKWPNDVLVGSRKICGILVEQHGSGSRQGLLIGIGINVNNSLRDAPAEVAQRATSLFDLQEQTLDLTGLLISVLQRLDFRIGQLQSQPRFALSEVNRRNVLTGKVVSLQTADGVVEGCCLGIDEDGQLVLKTESDIIRCASGVVLRW